MSTSALKRAGAWGLVLAFCLSMAATFSFFTDRETKSTLATAGNIDLIFTDISSSKTGENNITSPNTSAIDRIWEKETLVADGGILNPGDFFDLSYTVSNTGSKSIDVKQRLVLTSSVELTEGAEEYTLTIQAAGAETVVPGTLSDDKMSIVYDLDDITLNGTRETEDGVDAAEQTFIVRLDFAKSARNAFMDSSLAVSYSAQAKQHRNTSDEDWADWADFEVEFEQVSGVRVSAYSFTWNTSSTAGLTAASDSEGVVFYKMSSQTPTIDELEGSVLTVTDNSSGETMSAVLTASNGALAMEDDLVVVGGGLGVVVPTDLYTIEGITFPEAGMYVVSDIASEDITLSFNWTPPKALADEAALSFEYDCSDASGYYSVTVDETTLIRVSAAHPTSDEIIGATLTLTNMDTGDTSSIIITDDGDSLSVEDENMYIVFPAICVVQSDGYTSDSLDAVFPKAGIYVPRDFIVDQLGTANILITLDWGNPIPIPDDPVAEAITDSSITLQEMDGCEYSIDGTNWQDSTAFTGLTSHTTYTVYARYRATEDIPVSQISSATFTTLFSAPVAPSGNIFAGNYIVLNEISGCEYSIDGINWQDSTTFTGLSPSTEYTFYARYKSDDAANPAPSSSAKLSTVSDEIDSSINYETYTIFSSGLADIGYTGEEDEELVVPAVFYNAAENTWYKVTSVGNNAFYSADSMKSIVLPSTVTWINQYAFLGCEKLTYVDVGGTTRIAWEAFCRCYALETVNLRNVVSIGESAFSQCTSLKSLTIPNTVTTIDKSAFAYCDGLTEVTIPGSVANIGTTAFQCCDNLKTVFISKGVYTVGYQAFYYCTALQTVYLPSTLQVINKSAFAVCSNLSLVYYAGTEEAWSEIGIREYNTPLTNATITYNHSFE